MSNNTWFGDSNVCWNKFSGIQPHKIGWWYLFVPQAFIHHLFYTKLRQLYFSKLTHAWSLRCFDFSSCLLNELAMGGLGLLLHRQENLNQWQPVCFLYLTNSTPTKNYRHQTSSMHTLPCCHIHRATHTHPDHILTSLPPTRFHNTHPQTHLTDFISCEAWVRRLQCIYRSNTWLLAILII